MRREAHYLVYWGLVQQGGSMDNVTGAYRTESLPVGGSFHLRTGKDWIYYAGLVSEDVFSMVQLKQKGYQGYGWNLYFPVKSQDLIIDGVGIHVIRATATDIEFRVTD